MSEEQENLALLVPATKPKPAPTLYFIVVIKLFKGIVLLLAAAGIFSLAGKDLSDEFDQFIRWIHLDPEHSFFQNIGDWLDTITAANVRAVALGTLLYGLFLLVGGTGLAFRAKWAIWLAIGESAFFVPIEVRHLVEKFSWFVFGLTVINIIVVWYLYAYREVLFHHHHRHPHPLAGT